MKLFIPRGYAANPVWLAFLRCGIAMMCLLQFLAIQSDFDNLFGENGLVPPDVLEPAKPSHLPTVYSLHILLSLSYSTVLIIVRIAYPVCLILLGLGLVTRASAVLSLVLQLVVTASICYYNYGADVFTTICLFYCCVFPVGKVHSLDNKLFKQGAPLVHHNKYLALIQAHICIAYFFSGFEKMLGHSWRNGEAIWKMVHGYNSTTFVNLDAFYNTPIFLLAAWATIILEMLYPLFINLPKTRRLWLYGVILFHVSIAVFIGLYFFSAIMIIINLTCYYAPFIKMAPADEKAFVNTDNAYNTSLPTIA